MTAIVLIVLAAMIAADVTGRMVTWARRRALVDVPNERSSHVRPTPTGAGIAIVAVVLAGVLAIYFRPGATPAGMSSFVVSAVLVGCLVAAVSWIDDHRGLSPLVRLAVHAAAAGLLLGIVGPIDEVPVPFAGPVDLGIAGAVLTVWWLVGFANAYNFMDGIDGLAGAQGVIAGLAWGVAGVLTDQPLTAALGWLAAGACLGFLRHNWSPATIFMGDVGAVFLGFVFASLAFIGARQDPLLAIFGIAVVWPFVFDTSFTFLRRAFRRENLLQAHRSHLYQRLVIAGWSHRAATLLYAAAAVLSSAAGMGLFLRGWLTGLVFPLVLLAIAIGLWSITVIEEARQRMTDGLDVPVGARLSRFTRNRYILLADVMLVTFSACAAFALRFDVLFIYHRTEFPLFLAVALCVKPLVFVAFGLYKRYWRYASIWDLVAIVLAVSTAEVVVATVMTIIVMLQAPLLGYSYQFPRSTVLIDWLVTLTCTGGVRMAVRVFSESSVGRGWGRDAGSPDGRPKRMLIVGAGEAGILVLREIRRNPALNMEVVGFLDDDRTKHGKRIQATTVLGPLGSLAEIAESHRVDEAIIALPTAPGTVVRRVIESCNEAGIGSKAVPGMFELLDGNLSISRLRKVEIGDLLRRSQVSISPESARYLAGQTVLVTGAGGSIGSELCYQIARARPARLVLLGHGENSIFAVRNELRERAPGLPVDTVIADVRDEIRVRRTFQRFRPTAVFHAAAHKHVPLMEENPEEAVTNNVFGTRNVVQAAIEADVHRLVLISTDKAVQPASVMGVTKRIAETIVSDAAQRHDRPFVVVRFGNVLGSRGSVVPTFKRQIELGKPIQITHPDMKRFFMTIPESVHLVLEAGGLGRRGELFVLNMGQPVAIVDLARDLIRLSGCDVEDIPIVFTGLRPGEKLEEALWEPDAAVQPTQNPDVLRVTETPLVRGSVDEVTAFLQSAVETGDRTAVLFALSACVPSFMVPAHEEA
jgi:FlaA1/EpsC-like NDP-sugar epimerase/UDP-N-acetylmuramyl pentapeptide phosphotransferase/UDP-N-acetylglucosamine-1-phosphate transferase